MARPAADEDTCCLRFPYQRAARPAQVAAYSPDAQVEGLLDDSFLFSLFLLSFTSCCKRVDPEVSTIVKDKELTRTTGSERITPETNWRLSVF